MFSCSCQRFSKINLSFCLPLVSLISLKSISRIIWFENGTFQSNFVFIFLTLTAFIFDVTDIRIVRSAVFLKFIYNPFVWFELVSWQLTGGNSETKKLICKAGSWLVIQYAMFHNHLTSLVKIRFT